MDRQEEIRLRAHQIWEAEGRPDGKEAEHWARAEQELSGRDGNAGAGEQTEGGIASGLQPGGTTPSASPGAGVGSLGTGGGSTAGRSSWNVRKMAR